METTLAAHVSFPSDPTATPTDGGPSVAGIVEFGDPDRGRRSSSTVTSTWFRSNATTGTPT